MPVGKRALVGPILVLALLIAVNANSESRPVSWSVKMGGTENSIMITVLSRVRIKDVRCEVKLLDAAGKQVGSFTARFADQDNASLSPGVEHVENFTLPQQGVKQVEGLLLFARPVLSSPKATGGSAAGLLSAGIPPQGSAK